MSRSKHSWGDSGQRDKEAGNEPLGFSTIDGRIEIVPVWTILRLACSRQRFVGREPLHLPNDLMGVPYRNKQIACAVGNHTIATGS